MKGNAPASHSHKQLPPACKSIGEELSSTPHNIERGGLKICLCGAKNKNGSHKSEELKIEEKAPELTCHAPQCIIIVIIIMMILKKSDVPPSYALFKELLVFLGVRWETDECVLVKTVSGC